MPSDSSIKNNSFSAGTRVRLINDLTRTGFLTGREQSRRNRRILQVQFSEGIRWVPENQIAIVDSFRLSPLDMLEQGKLGRAIDLRRTLTHVKLSGRLADVIYSMEATNTDFYAYQFKPVIKILESPSSGILIADEVGLGKTIEAGLIWTELRSRFDMRRLVVLCPAALREKWQRELKNKFGVPAEICDAKKVLEYLGDEGSRERGFALVASTQGLRPPRGWEDKSSSRTSAKLAAHLRANENKDRLIDLLVIDEAHYLRNERTQTHKLGQLFKDVTEYAALLTATPIHNRNRDLFSLLTLLDPDTFTRPDAFSQILEANGPLVKARDILLQSNPDISRLKNLIQTARSHPLLESNRQLKMIEASELNTENISQKDIRSRLAYRLETVNLLAHVVTRTRKRDVKEWRVIREPVPEPVPLKQIEEDFYNLVTEVVVKYSLLKKANERFLLATPQRQMTSSMPAALRAWQAQRIELEEMTETGIKHNDDKKRRSFGPLVKEIVRRSNDYVDLNLLIKADSKYNRLKEILSDFLKKYPHEKVVLFSTFRATLDYLHERLSEEGISTIKLMGGQRETKDETIQRFREPNGPSVLLSSEVGGEGVDLQFSRVVINYDLPWNPMRIEQRIGRIDRLGQDADVITIWNLFYAGTIDARIYSRLYDKLDLCRAALGDFEAILGDEIRTLEIDLLSGVLSPEKQEERIDQTAQALENLRLEESTLEHNSANLIAYGDYILNQVHAARELHRWISGSDIQRYLFDYLRMKYPGCDLLQIEPASQKYKIELSQEAKFDLTEFIRERKLVSSTRLTAYTTHPVICIFDNRAITSLNTREEIISQFHPLVRMVSSQITTGEEQLTPAVAIVLKRQAVELSLAPDLYVLAAAKWTFKGLQDSERLEYAAVPLGHPGKLIPPESAEKLALSAISGGEDWLEAKNLVDLDLIYRIANDTLFGSLDEKYEIMKLELRAKNEDRGDLQLKTLDQHLEHQTEILERVMDSHRFRGNESLVKATEGRLRAVQHRVEQQRMRIESRKEIMADSQEIAIAIIKLIS